MPIVYIYSQIIQKVVALRDSYPVNPSSPNRYELLDRSRMAASYTAGASTEIGLLTPFTPHAVASRSGNATRIWVGS